jgi:diguanylate cyclase (GGDEF)-like protein/PAS domain S-box-containing protein
MALNQFPKIDALMTILKSLDAGSKLTVGNLTQELGVTARTIYRYFDNLQAAGYPIYFDRQQKSYRFVDTYQLRHTSAEKHLTGVLEIKQKMLAASSFGIAAYQFDGKCVLANESIARMINATREQVLAQNFRSLKSWRASGLLAMAEEVMRCEEERSKDFHVRSTFGKENWLHCVITPFTSEGQRYFFLMIHDISTRKQHEMAMSALISVISKGPMLILITDRAGTIEYVSDKITEITGYSADEVIGKPHNIFRSELIPAQAYEDIWHTISSGREWNGEVYRSRKDGSNFWSYTRISPVFAADGAITNFVAVTEDITRHKQLEEELYRHATIDMLTRLYNRRMILELGEREIAIAQRHCRPLAVLMVDIDYFTQINVSYGHAAGDEVLRALADTFRSSVRSCDLLGRVGGEEFVVILPDTSVVEAREIAERLRANVAQASVHWKEDEISTTVSVGIALLQEKDTGLAQLMEKADKALYTAKKAGRNRVHETLRERDELQAGQN